LLEDAGVWCELELPDGEIVRCGHGPPAFRVTFKSWRMLRMPLNEFALGRAYVEGDIDL
jgi:cyclopropane-fatty-acyl-phospholipid synthase